MALGMPDWIELGITVSIGIGSMILQRELYLLVIGVASLLLGGVTLIGGPNLFNFAVAEGKFDIVHQMIFEKYGLCMIGFGIFIILSRKSSDERLQKALLHSICVLWFTSLIVYVPVFNDTFYKQADDHHSLTMRKESLCIDLFGVGLLFISSVIQILRFEATSPQPSPHPGCKVTPHLTLEVYFILIGALASFIPSDKMLKLIIQQPFEYDLYHRVFSEMTGCYCLAVIILTWSARDFIYPEDKANYFKAVNVVSLIGVLIGAKYGFSGVVSTKYLMCTSPLLILVVTNRLMGLVKSLKCIKKHKDD